MWREIIKIPLYALSNLCYPKQCLHCDESLFGQEFFCSSCQMLLEVLPLDGQQQKGSCGAGTLQMIDAVFRYEGPAASAVKALKFKNMPYLAQGMGALMAHRYLSSGRPLPDIIVPVPLAAMHMLQRGYNQSALLAEHFGTIVKRPVVNVLGRYSGAYAQMNLSGVERQKLDNGWFAVVEQVEAQKNVVLIDDVITTGATLHCCAQRLLDIKPLSINAMAFAKA